MKSHPGGWLPIQAVAGKKDASDRFEAFHPQRVFESLLPNMLIGVVDPEELGGVERENPIEQVGRDVRQVLLERNLFETKPGYYVKMFVWFAVLFAGAIYLTAGTRHFLWGAVVMGMFWQQVAFVGHDVGHNAISHIRKEDLFWGVLLGNPLMGISLGWWKQSHNVHHVVCNSVEHDPDIQHLPMFAVSEKIFNQGPFQSTYHKKRFEMDFFARHMVIMQHFLFYPVMAVARINLYVQSWVNLILQPHGRVPYREMEMATLLFFFCWIGSLLSVLPTWQDRVMWVALSHAVSGLLHVQICLSHFPMAAHREGDESRSEGWYSMQMQTTLNVDCPPWLDWLHGGLQFQIEHHLYPRLPRHNLREARRLFRSALKAKGLLSAYHEKTFINANMYMMQTMGVAAKHAKELRKGNGGFYASPMYAGLNLEG